ncbi:hypothetical protein GUITHDRAFT_69609 [Guillardia theta CCMP2712]|uniref:Uncharacterized protein n=1 Tax=Guillardia theta (strain CCMP2712) TaxID=905079 RepID=L1JG59_GUITC|nr:hypothetical protein GUITHDRAFT_69609 [Guillardia theta CCMP2712]EKX47486.1 hypothetical protein GUITHDRAFT_69609 [Guillardia theta CCMP2712]|eukprot:XP_005834466.1 hypothetical protein GUITHDRAFT_69609 [Guillardia theta CCMP2712]
MPTGDARIRLHAASTAIPAVTLKGFILLSSCIACGVSGATSMKLSNGFKNFWPSVMIFVSYALAFVLFTKALLLWPLSIAYAVWSGLGTAATAVIGVAFFKESLKPVHLLGLALIIVGVSHVWFP